MAPLARPERWRSVKVTEFERRQMAAVRKELDQEYEATTSLRKGAHPRRIIQHFSDLTRQLPQLPPLELAHQQNW
jgi:hypothetical protein